MFTNLFLIKIFFAVITSILQDNKKSKYLGDPLSAPIGSGPLGTTPYTYPYV